MWTIQFTPNAIEDLRSYRKRDRKRIIERIVDCLQDAPEQETRNNKCLRPNRLAQWELRVDWFRVFYDQDADSATVTIVAVGHKKGNRLHLRGEEFTL
jgi:mRNA-degrading endonuclease RelE of RelBE toxin-antitoxin system